MKVKIKIKNKKGGLLDEMGVDTEEFQQRIDAIDTVLLTDLNIYPNNIKNFIEGYCFPQLKQERFEKNRWLNRVNKYKDLKDNASLNK